MSHMLDSLLGQLNSERLQSLSQYMGESTEKVYAASRGFFATVLGSLLTKSNDIGLENTLRQAAAHYPNPALAEDRVFSGNLTDSEKSNARLVLNHVLGEKTGVLQNRLASANNISPESSGKLMEVLALVFGGFTGQKMRNEGWSLKELTSKIYDERATIYSSLPEGFTTLFGLGALTAVGGVPFHEGVILHYLDNTHTPTPEEEQTHAKSRKWIGYLMLLIVLLLMAYFIRSCKSCNDEKGPAETVKVMTDTDTPKPVATAAPMPRESVKVILPSGKELNAYKGGIEEQVVEFLKSGAIDKMSEDELKNKWFDFDNINYEFGSTDKITAESQVQLDNLVAILKEFKTAKIKLGTYTDKKGDDAANLKLSQGRANDMKKRFEAADVGAQIAGAEGYGEQFAKVDESKSDEERAVDRRISLRFVK